MENLEIIFENLWLSAWERATEVKPIQFTRSLNAYFALGYTLQDTVLHCVVHRAALYNALCCIAVNCLSCNSLEYTAGVFSSSLHFAQTLHCVALVCTRYAPDMLSVWILICKDYQEWKVRWKDLHVDSESFNCSLLQWLRSSRVGGSSNIKISLIWPFCSSHSYSDSSK